MLQIKWAWTFEGQDWYTKYRSSPLRFPGPRVLNPIFAEMPNMILQYVQLVGYVPPKNGLQMQWGMDDGIKRYVLLLGPFRDMNLCRRLVAYLLAGIVLSYLQGTQVLRSYYIAARTERTPLYPNETLEEDFVKHFSLFLVDRYEVSSKTRMRYDRLKKAYQEIWSRSK